MEALGEEALPRALGLDVREVHLDREGLVRTRLPENLDLLLGRDPSRPRTQRSSNRKMRVGPSAGFALTSAVRAWIAAWS